MNKNNLTDTRRGGFYFKEDKPYLSTTEILKIINKPALSYWFGREVYRAMLLDPTMDEKTALSAPGATSSVAKDRGKTIHSIVENYKATGEIIDTIPEQFKKYASAFYQFMKDHKVEIVEQEKTIFDEVNKVAGTLDMYCKIGDSLMILDVKTGKDIYSEVRLQLSSYANMMRLAGHKIDEICVLLLETGEDGLPTGKYKFETLEEDFEAFLAAKKLYEWDNKEKLIKLGYL
jgi:predicted RecB family nuclease